MVDGGNADGSSVWAIGRSEKGFDRRIGRQIKSGRGGIAGDGVGFNDRDELDDIRMGSFKLSIDTDVVAAKCAYSDDGYANGVCRHGYFLEPLVGASTASRQRT